VARNPPPPLPPPTGPRVRRALSTEFGMAAEGMRQGPQSAILWYAMLRASDRFYDATGRLPGVSAVTVGGTRGGRGGGGDGGW
jgi:hypothetical protein